MKKKSLTLLLVFVLFYSVNDIAISANKKSKNKKNKSTTENVIQNASVSSIDTPNVNKDTIIPDREIEFDLLRISRYASINAFGRADTKMNGKVVLEVTIDSTGIPIGFIMREHTNPKLIPLAREAIQKWAKKVKLQPTIRNGKPVRVEGLLVPVIFDMSMFEENK